MRTVLSPGHATVKRGENRLATGRPWHSHVWLLAMTAAVLVLVFAVPIYRQFEQPHPRAVAGLLDLRQWEASDTETIRLDGEWDFYWNRLLTPPASGQLPFAGDGMRTQVPSSWDSLFLDGKRLPDRGCATYRLRILLPEGHAPYYGVKTSNIRASNRIFVNGDQVGRSGWPAADPEEIIHRNTPYAVFFEVHGNEAELLVQVASFKSFNSGIVQSLFFGSEPAIGRLNNYNNAMDGGLAAGFGVLAFYFVGIFLQRRSNRELLFFGLCCLATFIYLITHSERLLMQLFPEMSIELQLYVEDISAILMFSFFSRYVYHSFPDLYPRRVLLGIELAAAVYIAAVLLTTASYNGPFIQLLSFTILAVMLLNCFYMARAAFRYKDGAVYLYLGILGALDFVIVNMLNIMWKLEEHFFLPVALPLLVMSQALYMSRQYTQSYRTIQLLSDRLTMVDRLKDEFLAKTSHELKTPLNAIVNITDSLLQGAGGQLSVQQTGDLTLVADTGRRLSTLVQEILDYSRMKNRDLVLNRVYFDSYMIIDHILRIFRRMVDASRITLVNQVPEGEFMIRADKDRFSQIIHNLLENAVKYTPEGSVRVWAERTGGYTVFIVEDTGIGIPEEKFGDIFKSFEQLEPSLTRSHGGVGLGLSITQQLVELHGGRVEVESQVGQGTRMTVMLPYSSKEKGMEGDNGESMRKEALERLQQTEAYVPLSPDSEIQAASGTGARILAADDDYGNLKALSNLLILEGYSVTCVRDGEEVLRLISEGGQFDLCILDIMMPRLSGFEVAFAIRQQYSLLELPVLLLTARSRRDSLSCGFTAGANDFLEKPYDRTELKSRVRTLLQLKRSGEELLRKELSFLQAQIKPHFVYNTLNAILSFSYTDHLRSRKLLQDFSTYLRYSFDFREAGGLVALEQEETLLRAYVSIEQARFGDMLQVEIELEPEARSIRVPSLLLQPLVENAIRHGVMKREDGGLVRVRAWLEAERLRVTVEDNGVGFEVSGPESQEAAASGERRGIGLDNIRIRLGRLHGSGFAIESRPGVGTRIEIMIPAGK